MPLPVIILIKRLEAQFKDIATLRSEIESLKARQKAVEDLQTNRNVPVHLLDELARHTPEGIYLTSIKQTGDRVVISGVAQTSERVSEYLRNTQNQSRWMHRPELVEIKAVTLAPAAGSREQRRLYDFSMRLQLTNPAAQPAEGASAPAKAPAKEPEETLAMAQTTRPAGLDAASRLSRAGSQFKGLNPREPGQWPLLPKVCAWLAATAEVVGGDRGGGLRHPGGV